MVESSVAPLMQLTAIKIERPKKVFFGLITVTEKIEVCVEDLWEGCSGLIPVFKSKALAESANFVNFPLLNISSTDEIQRMQKELDSSVL